MSFQTKQEQTVNDNDANRYSEILDYHNVDASATGAMEDITGQP